MQIKLERVAVEMPHKKDRKKMGKNIRIHMYALFAKQLIHTYGIGIVGKNSERR